MLNAILGLFTSFNPVIVGLMLSAGAYIALRHRMVAVPSAVTVAARRVAHSAGLAHGRWIAN